MFADTSTTLTHNLGPVEQIPIGEGRAFQIDQQQVAVFRTRDGGLFATQAECPHKGGPLIDGIVGAGKVVCPLHAYKFELDTGQPAGNGCQPLKTYRARINAQGEIVITLD